MDRGKKIVQVSIVGIAVNMLLVVFKAAVGFASGSVAIIMDAVNNMSDALSSVITIIGTKLAERKPDKNHPYGYGQIEYISSVTIAVIVLIAGLSSLKESFDKVLHPRAASYTTVSLLIIAVAVVAKFLLGRYVKSQGEKYDSDSLVASGMDAVFDCVISLSTLAAAAMSMIWHISVEGWLGLVISLVIFKAGVEILMDSMSNLIGRRVDSKFSKTLKMQIAKHPGVLGAYDLVLHRYGPRRTIGSVHVEVPDSMTATEIHRLSRNIMDDVYNEHGIVLTVGVYASNTDNKESARIRQHLLGIVAQYPEILQMHGFYVDKERMLMSFDIIIDFKYDNRYEIRDNLAKRLEEEYPGYTFSIGLDGDFSD